MHVFAKQNKAANGMFLGYLILAFAYLVMMFTSPSLRWFMVLYLVLSSVSSAGTGQNATNIMYKCIEQKYFIQANAITNVISGLLGFTSSLVGGYILGKIGSEGCTVMGTTVYGQQILAGISLGNMIVAIVFSYFAILRPENKMKKTLKKA